MTPGAIYRNPATGTQVELGVPDERGWAEVMIDGQIVMVAKFTDAPRGPAVTLADGTTLCSVRDFARCVVLAAEASVERALERMKEGRDGER